MTGQVTGGTGIRGRAPGSTATLFSIPALWTAFQGVLE